MRIPSTDNKNVKGIYMKIRITSFLAALVAVMAWGPTAYAACPNAEFAGTWDATFSDGNSCRIVLNREGDVLADESVCYDPFRGTTTPDSGTLITARDCSVTGNIVVEGVTVALAGQFARGRDTGAGRYLVEAFFVKGSFTMIRVP